MDFGDSPQTQLTERIMARIREHLKKEPPPHDSHHYNRVYETVHAVLTEEFSKFAQRLPPADRDQLLRDMRAIVAAIIDAHEPEPETPTKETR
jgi:predicted glycoside hydrolase/deacetylase ChbG (UPF0249 family)